MVSGWFSKVLRVDEGGESRGLREWRCERAQDLGTGVEFAEIEGERWMQLQDMVWIIHLESRFEGSHDGYSSSLCRDRFMFEGMTISGFVLVLRKATSSLGKGTN